MTASHEPLIPVIEQQLIDSKARDIQIMNLKGAAQFADTMIVASGTSTRHVASIARTLQDKVKEKCNLKAQGIEGLETADWVLVDFGDIIVHVMLPTTRQFYELEKLWKARPDQTSPSASVDE